MQSSNRSELPDDILNREPIAEKLVSLLTDDQLNLSPILINGKWGSGKTTFCKRLLSKMDGTSSDKVLMPIYINAYQEDHIDDPLLSCISALRECIQESKIDENLKDTILNTSKNLAKLGTKLAIKAFNGVFF